jgi:hypothetical protein
MIFEQDKSTEKWGKRAGFAISYCVFTAILFFILQLAGKLPDSWSILHITTITLSVTVVGSIIKRLLI